MLLVRGLLLLAQTEEPTPFSVAWFQLHKWDLGVTIAVAVVLTIVARRWSRRYRRRTKGGGDDAESRRRRRVATVIGLLSGIIVVIAWFVFLLTLLKDLGVDITPIIASAGIAGIALGFGAQTIVRDSLIRVVHLHRGAVRRRRHGRPDHLLGNGVGNDRDAQPAHDGGPAVRRDALDDPERADRGDEQPHARMGARGRRPPGVAGRGPRPRARRRWRSWSRRSRRSRRSTRGSANRPQVLGVTQLTNVAQVIRIAAETEPSHRIDVERLLRAKVVARMSERGIKAPPVVPGMPRPPE